MRETPAFFPSGFWRATAVALLTILLHWLLIERGRQFLTNTAVSDVTTSSISVTLRSLEPPKQAVSLPTAAPVRPRVVRKRVSPAPAAKSTDSDNSVAPVVQSAVAPDAAVATAPDVAENPPADAPANGTASSGTDLPEANAEPLDKDNSVPNLAEGTHYQIDPPPSVELKFDVQAFSDNLNWYGTSTLTWNTDGTRYRIDGEVYTRLFAKIGFLNFSSTGDINAFGVAPELYTEKKRNRAATNTHFNRERNVVSFSASTTSYPRVGGEQDRASLVWQLAAIGRGDPGKFSAGAVIDLFVAGVRDGEVWRMQVAGLEDIRLVNGTTQAWHVIRQPRPGSYEQRLDIWLEPGRQWYPARLRFTETNGDYLEMSLTDLKALSEKSIN